MTETEYKKVPIGENEETYNLKDEEAPVKYGYGMRHIQALLYFLCLLFCYEARGHLGVTIVAMTMVTNTNTTIRIEASFMNVTVNDSISNNITYIIRNATAHTIDNETDVTSVWDVHKTYDWPKSIQEVVLGAFFLGYSIMMFPIGLVCQRWGGKIPLQIALFVNGLASFCTPWFIAWGGWKALCGIRVIQGLSQAGLYPAMHTLLSNWVPVSERGSLSSYVYTGNGLGTVIAFQLAGILAFSRFGWPSTFWATGVACFIVFLLLTFFGAKTPNEHKSISEAEKKYIAGRLEDSVETIAKVPWKSVFSSVHVWATIVAHTGNAVCFVFFFMQVPTYMFGVLKLNIMSSGILSSLPYLASGFSAIAFGFLSDFVTNRKILSTKNARKIFNSIACVIPALCLALVSYTTNTALAVTCFIVSLTAHAALHTGWMINYIDLSPNFSGALMATGNTMTNIVVLLLPIMVSNIVTDVTNQYQWRITMFLMAALTFISNLIFIIFMSVDVQPWNDGENHTKDTKPESEKLKLEAKNGKADNQ